MNERTFTRIQLILLAAAVVLVLLIAPRCMPPN